jgi:hypothetical protein
MSNNKEYYGSPDNIAAMKRGAALWSLLKNDQRFAFYGRLVAASQPLENTAEVISSLARLQGGAPCYFFPKSEIDTLNSELKEKGFSTDRFEHFLGEEAAYAAARQALQNYSLPSDLVVKRLDKETPGDFVGKVVELMESCEVMPVPASYLRGSQGNGICLVATDNNDMPIAAATSIFLHPSASPYAKTVFWGMLATRPDRRGQKIALLLGAQAIVHMWEEKGARGFMTGVRNDNLSSITLCNRLGVTDTNCAYAVCIDPQTLGRKSVTK